MQTRKEFILKITRAASLTVLASTTGYLLFREPSDKKCNFDFVCNNCKKLKSCSLNKATQYKNTKTKSTR